MVRPVAILMCVVVASLEAGCLMHLAGGTSYHAARGLRRRGYAEELIDRVTGEGWISPEEFQRLRKERQPEVRCCLAMNPNVPVDYLVGVFRTERDVYILSGLARNPALPQSMLLELRTKRGVPARAFVGNPACPAAIQNEILAGDDEDAKYWLRWTQERNKK